MRTSQRDGNLNDEAGIWHPCERGLPFQRASRRLITLILRMSGED